MVLSEDYFSVPDEDIKRLESVLTIVGGRTAYAAAEFEHLSPPLPALPESSPVAKFGGHGALLRDAQIARIARPGAASQPRVPGGGA